MGNLASIFVLYLMSVIFRFFIGTYLRCFALHHVQLLNCIMLKMNVKSKIKSKSSLIGQLFESGVYSNDVYKPWIANGMYWPLTGFEDTSRPFWHSPVGAVLHKSTLNSTVFQLNVSRTKWHVFKYLFIVGTVISKLYCKETFLYYFYLNV